MADIRQSLAAGLPWDGGIAASLISTGGRAVLNSPLMSRGGRRDAVGIDITITRGNAVNTVGNIFAALNRNGDGDGEMLPNP